MDALCAQTGSRPRAKKCAILIALLAATVAGFCLRHAAAGSFVLDADERVYMAQMELLRAHDPHPEWTSNFDFYPLGIARLALLTQPHSVVEAASVDSQVRAADADIRHARTIVALIAALAIPATFFLARRFLSNGWALFAALLFAASPLGVAFGDQARPHAALVTPMIGAVLACVHVRNRPVIASYVLAGIAIGAALAVLHSGAAVIPSLFAAHVLRERKRARAAGIGLCAALGIAIAIALLAYPPGATGFEMRATGENFDLSGHTIALDHFRGGGFHKLARALFDYEPWLALLASGGCALFVVRSVTSTLPIVGAGVRADALVVAAWCVPYLLVCGLFDDAYERFFLPLLPCAAIAAAYGCAALTRALFADSARRTGAALTVGALALTPQLCSAAQLARAWSQEDTLRRCAKWIEDNVPPESARIAVFYSVDLPLLRTVRALHASSRLFFEISRPWIRYQAHMIDDGRVHERYDVLTVPCGGPRGLDQFDTDLAASIASWHAQYVVLDLGRPMLRANATALRAKLRACATCVARISPYDDESCDAPFSFDQVPETQGWWTGRLWRAQGIGPVVEVYRLP